MTNVEITYNPYTVETKIIVDGEEPKSNSQFKQYLNKKERLQMWVDKIPTLLSNEYNDDEFKLTFHGTELDYQDLMAAIKAAKGNNLSFEVEKIPAKEFGEKEKNLKELFARIKTLSFDEFRSPAVADAFELAFNAQLEVNVIATMSAGKSTLINALLGKKLMPSKQGACTATITRITDDDKPDFKADAFDENGKKLKHFPLLDYETMVSLNKNPQVSEIDISGDIPFVGADEVALVLIDTPGPDNARDRRHGIITEEALKKSSKMLVLFVMNGSTLNNTAQDRFLRRIAKSMSVEGKQSKERFIFVINKIDEYEEGEDDIEGETIPETIKYLEDMGIKNPNVFPAAALLALMIRRYQNSSDEKEKKSLLDDIKPKANKLIKQKQLHLEKYHHLPKSCEEIINSELQKAIENRDDLGQALVHSGIRGIEEMIRMYVTKYSRPDKITNVVNSLRKALESAEAFTKIKKEISSRQNELKEIGKKLEQLNTKIASKEENENFKKELDNLDFNSQVEKNLNILRLNLEEFLTNFSRKHKDVEELEENIAKSFFQTLMNLANQIQNEYQIKVAKIIDSDIKKKSEKLLKEYVKKLDAISEEFNGEGLKINLESYVKSELISLKDDDTIFADATDIRTVTEPVTKKVRKRYTGWERWLNPWRWFFPDYEEVILDTKPTVKTFVRCEKIINIFITHIRENIRKEREQALSYAKKETEKIIKYFKLQFDKVDEILTSKVNELKSVTQSKSTAEAALIAAKEHEKELEKISTELKKIMEI